jgi:hypothetical protein
MKSFKIFRALEIPFSYFANLDQLEKLEIYLDICLGPAHLNSTAHCGSEPDPRPTKTLAKFFPNAEPTACAPGRYPTMPDAMSCPRRTVDAASPTGFQPCPQFSTPLLSTAADHRLSEEDFSLPQRPRSTLVPLLPAAVLRTIPQLSRPPSVRLCQGEFLSTTSKTPMSRHRGDIAPPVSPPPQGPHRGWPPPATERIGCRLHKPLADAALLPVPSNGFHDHGLELMPPSTAVSGCLTIARHLQPPPDVLKFDRHHPEVTAGALLLAGPTNCALDRRSTPTPTSTST